MLGTARGGSLERTILEEGAEIHVPFLCDVEVASAFRRLLRAGVAGPERVHRAVEDYLDLSLTRHGHALLLPRILELRENFSAYDAAYVALAEVLGAPFMTGDERLGRAVRAHTALELLE